jgi:hypothetical protein
MKGEAVRSCVLVVVLLSSMPLLSRPAQATEVSLDLRQTLVQPKSTPESVVFPTLTLALAIGEHVWVGAGYEMAQNHDAVFFRSELSGERPISLSAIRVGCWYRGGERRYGLTYAIGPLVTYANTAISLGTSPSGVGNDTYFVDAGADMSIGYVGRRGRVEAFMAPARSYGRVVSPAAGKTEHPSAFVARIGVAFTLLLGS